MHFLSRAHGATRLTDSELSFLARRYLKYWKHQKHIARQAHACHVIQNASRTATPRAHRTGLSLSFSKACDFARFALEGIEGGSTGGIPVALAASMVGKSIYEPWSEFREVSSRMGPFGGGR